MLKETHLPFTAKEIQAGYFSIPHFLVKPECFEDRIISLYHSSLYIGHQGVIKTYLAINAKFFIPSPIHYLRVYIKGCHICQLHRNEKPQPKQLENGINPSYKAMTRLSRDLKVMSRSYKGHRFTLVAIDKVTSFVVVIPIHQSQSERIGDALVECMFSKYRILKYMIMDQDSAFMSLLINYLFQK